jgi:hypothetical protein
MQPLFVFICFLFVIIAQQVRLGRVIHPQTGTKAAHVVFMITLAAMNPMFTAIDAVQVRTGLSIAAMTADFVLQASTLLRARLLLLLLSSLLLPLSYSEAAIVIVTVLLRLFCRL